MKLHCLFWMNLDFSGFAFSRFWNIAVLYLFTQIVHFTIFHCPLSIFPNIWLLCSHENSKKNLLLFDTVNGIKGVSNETFIQPKQNHYMYTICIQIWKHFEIVNVHFIELEPLRSKFIFIFERVRILQANPLWNKKIF